MLRLSRIKQRNDQKPVSLAPDPRNFGPNISRQILYQTGHYRRVQQNSNSKRPQIENYFYNQIRAIRNSCNAFWLM
jgi:hypothetical protein